MKTKLEIILTSITHVQHLINLQRDDSDVKKAIAQIKIDLCEDIENTLGDKFKDLTD